MSVIVCPTCSKRLKVEPSSKDFCFSCKTAFSVSKDLTVEGVFAENRTDNKNRRFITPIWLKFLTAPVFLLFFLFTIPLFELGAIEMGVPVYFQFGMPRVTVMPFSFGYYLAKFVFLLVTLASFGILAGFKWALYPAIALTVIGICMSLYVGCLLLFNGVPPIAVELLISIPSLCGLISLIDRW